MKGLKRSPLIGVAIVLVIAIILLGLVNMRQRATQPRYRLVGQALVVTPKNVPQGQPAPNNGGNVAQNGQVAPQQPQPQQVQPTYYIFNRQKIHPKVVVTNDLKTAKSAQKNVEGFNKAYRMIRSTGVKQSWYGSHHGFTVNQDNVDENGNVTGHQVLLKGTKIKFHGKQIKGTVTNPQNGNAQENVQLLKVNKK